MSKRNHKRVLPVLPAAALFLAGAGEEIHSGSFEVF